MLLKHAGLEIITNPTLIVEDGEDWSEVRSPARARRRLKRGFPQRIRTKYKPDPKIYRMGNRLFMHPAIADTLRKEIAVREEREFFCPR